MSEKAFDATKSVMGMFGAFFKAVAQEIGWIEPSACYPRHSMVSVLWLAR